MTVVYAAMNEEGKMDVFGSEESAEEYAGENGDVEERNVQFSTSHYFQSYHYERKGGYTLQMDEEGNMWEVDVQPSESNDIIDRLENGESYEEVFNDE